MKLQLFWVIIAFAVICLFPSFASCQTWNLPDSRINDRHNLVDRFDIVRPALSIRGFDNQNLPSHFDTFDHEKVYGIKQVLERAYGIGQTAIIRSSASGLTSI